MEKGPIIANSISWNEKNDAMFLRDSPEKQHPGIWL
jgi:hypothetical protein